KFLARPATQRAIATALDKLLGAVPDARRTLDKERADLEARRKQIIDRIGTLYSDTEAKASLDEIRARLDALVAEGEHAKFTVVNRKALASERERLLGMAK